MKAKLLLAVLATAAVAYAAAQIEWTFHSNPILRITTEGETLELGLRSDGVVTWRKITQTTNSPAESPQETLRPWYSTNGFIQLTNIFWTNSVITNILWQ